MVELLATKVKYKVGFSLSDKKKSHFISIRGEKFHFELRIWNTPAQGQRESATFHKKK